MILAASLRSEARLVRVALIFIVVVGVGVSCLAAWLSDRQQRAIWPWQNRITVDLFSNYYNSKEVWRSLISCYSYQAMAGNCLSGRTMMGLPWRPTNAFMPPSGAFRSPIRVLGHGLARAGTRHIHQRRISEAALAAIFIKLTMPEQCRPTYHTTARSKDGGRTTISQSDRLQLFTTCVQIWMQKAVSSIDRRQSSANEQSASYSPEYRRLMERQEYSERSQGIYGDCYQPQKCRSCCHPKSENP